MSKTRRPAKSMNTISFYLVCHYVPEDIAEEDLIPIKEMRMID